MVGMTVACAVAIEEAMKALKLVKNNKNPVATVRNGVFYVIVIFS